MGASPTRHLDVERLSAWSSGDLSDRDAAAVRAHVDACAACTAVVAELRAQVLATRALDRSEPPPTLWSAIEGALVEEPRRRTWSWGATLTGALAGAAVAAVVFSGGLARLRSDRMSVGAVLVAGGEVGRAAFGSSTRPTDSSDASRSSTSQADDPLLAEAERELEDVALAYERAVGRLRVILDREQVLWDSATRARVGDRMARLDEAVAHSRAVARREPRDSTGADMLFSAYQRQIDFLAEAVHRGSPAAAAGLR